MWAERDDDLPQPPRPARTSQVAFRSHEEPESMGEDSYLRDYSQQATANRTSTSIRSESEGHQSSLDDGASATALRGAGAGMGVARSRSQNGIGHGRAASRTEVLGGEASQVPRLDSAEIASRPIGFLAALGTSRAKKLPFRSRKCLILVPLLGLISLVYPILRAVAIHTLHTSVLSVTGSNITSPTNNSFGLTLEGQVHKVGVFPARLSFKNPVDVYWINPDNMVELHLGNFRLAYIGVAAGHGRIKQETFFNIDDVAGFARFSEYLITQEAFTWRLKSEEVTAEAFGFIPAHGLTFDLTLPGMANMTDVSISDFQLPGDDPAGGISLAVTTQLTNPSAFGIEIGTLIVDLYYKDLYLGPAQTAHPINLTSGVNHINLVGRLLPYADDPAALEQLSEVFSNYLNGLPTATQARGRSVTLPNGEVITWLQIGIQALVLNVPLQSPTGRISPINSITIEALSLSFDPSAPYAPLSNSSQVSASFGLPFGFSLNIVELANQFSIIDNRTAVASLSAPLGMSQTTILTQNAGYTTGGITLDLPLSPLTIGPNYTEHLAFDQFTYDLTTTNGSKFILNGNTTAVTDTPLGQVKLSNIGFTVPAGLIGLESLATYPTTILSVDVVGGTPDAIILAIDVGLTNPSNLDLMVGNVTFQLFNGKSFLGTATLPDLHLIQGYQEHPSVSLFQANANPGALKVLTDFTSGTDTPLTISGFNGSTAVESLTQAFMALHLNATLKGLGTKLLNYANLTVLPTTGVNNDLASSIVSLQNPFSSDLRITEIQSNITHSSGLFVGSIVTPTDFLAKGHTANISPVLAFNLNLYPPDIFTLLRVLAVEAGLPTDQIDGIVALGGYTYVNITGARSLVRRNELEMGADSIHLALGDDYCVGEALSKRELQKRNIYSGFDLPSFVLTAFAALKVDVALVSVLHIGDFTTNLAYSQAEVPAYTDSTLTLLLPILARPIVQRIVDQAILSVTTVIITDPEEDSFVTQLVGAITNAGPFDAVITFTTGLTVAWNGAPLGQIAMPNVTLVEDVGAQLNIAAAFAVADVAHLTEFTGYLLTEPSFVWQIYGEELEVTALGITVAGISISKDVILDGMNGFKNGVVIDSFDLPANDPAGGVALTLATTLVNPSSVGISLSGIAFSNTFGNTVIGPAAATGAFILAPKATIALPLAGRLIPQTTPQGLQGVSTIFNGFIHGLPSDLIVHGVSAGPADVTWLNTGIQKLAIAVILPAMKLDVINSITINQLTLMFTEEEAYSPAFSTNDTVALFQLPFAFPVNIVQAATSITTKNSDAASVSRLAKRDTGDFATLNVPLLPSATDVQSRSLLLQFTNIPFKSIDNGIFSSFLLETTVGATKGLALHGSADTVTSTAIGDLSLVGIAFSVETAVQGLQGLNAQPTTVSDLDVFHGYSSYLQINANAHLFNPSEQLTIGTGDVAFGLMFQGQLIGTADITGLVLVPGVNVVPTMVHYSPSGSSQQASGQILLQNFIQGIVSDTLIVGNSGTTPIASLKAALSAVQLATTIPPLEQNLVTQASLSFPLDIGTTGVAEAQITLGNPFTAVINIDSVITNASYQGINLGQVKQLSLSPSITAPGHSSIISNALPFSLNTDPKVLIAFVEAAATAQGVDLGILLPVFSYVLGLSSTTSSVTSSVNQEPETCDPTGTTATVQALILAAVKNLKTNLTIESVVRLDSYKTPLDFVQNEVPTVLADSVLYLTGILGKTIVSQIVDVAELSFSGGLVNNVTDHGFTVALQGSLLNAGPFDALITFPSPVEVFWEGSHIADIALPPICSAGGQGVPVLETTGILTIADLGKFTNFATSILLGPSFTWTITTSKLRVFALGTIFDNVTLTKNVTFSAFNGLPGVTIRNPDFPGDAPNGIQLVTDSSIPSPSNLGIELGHASFIASFEGQEVGPIDAFGLVLAPLAVTDAHLTGTIIKRTSAASTTSLGVLFSEFLAGANQTLDVTGNEVVTPAQPNSPCVWLSAAFKKLTLHVILPGHVYEIISSVKLQDLTVTITSQSEAYSVPSQNNETDVVYKNPFGFSLTALQAGGSFIIKYNSVDTAVLTLPVANAVSAQTSTGQDANLVLDFKKPQILQSLDTAVFNQFFNDITNTAGVSFNLHGSANVTAGTNAGSIPITADASLFNPSNLTIVTTDVVFGLQFMSQVVGAVDIGDLLLVPGVNNLGTQVHYAPTGGASTAAGELLLANYVQGVDSQVQIVGTPQTTPFGSLQEALGTIQIQTSIPAIHQLLITEADLSFPLDVGTTGLALASFHLSNPFTASINLLGVVANATYQSFFLGQINQPTLNPPVSAGGHKNITSRTLPFTLTTDPKFLISFLEAAATAQGVDLGILLPEFAYVLGLASTTSTVTTSVNTKKETCAPTGTSSEVAALILAAVKNLRTDLGITSTLKLDDFQTDLAFVQNGVPTVLDDSVLYLTGLIGKTIVDEATLAFTGGFVSNLTDNGFTVALNGSLLNAGPFDALIEFVTGVDVYFMGTEIANIVLPPICSPGGISVPNLETTGILQITNQAAFTSFAAYLLLNPSFTWTITTPNLRVSALNTIFENVLLTKEVSFDAFDKLAPGVTVSDPDFPGDASNGIELTLNSLIPSPSNLGIELGDVSFIASYQGSIIGPVDAKALTLPAKSITAAPLTGVITYRDDPAGVSALGAVFSQFLTGQNTTLLVTGASVTSPAQPRSPVAWLSAAFQQFSFDVSLHGKQYEIISSILLKDLTVSITSPEEAFAALVTNNETDVVYRNPFKFSLQAIQAGGDFIINYANVDSALLTLPKEDSVSAQTSTGNDADLVIHIVTPAVLSSIDNGGYENFFSAITNDASVAFMLHGGANGGIPFSVSSSFPGIQGFNGKAIIPATPIVIGSGSGSDFTPSPGGTFLRITLDVVLSNPAPLILETNMVSFAVFYQTAQVGRAFVNPLNLLPGSNTIPSEFHYMPADAGDAVAQSLLTAYLETKGNIPLVVSGDLKSSPYVSLQPALSHISLQSGFPGQGLPLVHDIVIYLDLITVLCTNEVAFTFSINNHLETSITIKEVSGSASQNKMTYATFNNYVFKNTFQTTAGQAPGGESEKVEPTLLPMTAAGSLALFSPSAMAQGLDIDITASVLIDQYNAPSLQYSQTGVPYTIITTAGSTTLDLATLGANPVGTLTGLLGALGSLTECIAGGTALSILPALLSDVTAVLGDLSKLPPFLVSIIEGIPTLLPVSIPLPTSAISSVVAGVSSDVSAVIAPVTSIAGAVTSALGAAASPVTSIAAPLVSAASAAVAPIVSAATAAAAPVVTVAAPLVTILEPLTSQIAKRDVGPLSLPTSRPKSDKVVAAPSPAEVQRVLEAHGVRGVRA